MTVPRLLLRRLGAPGDLGWVVMAHGEQYPAEFGWDAGFEALVAKIVADYAGAHDPAREAAWIAEIEGKRVGCIFCVAADQSVAKLRLLLVSPEGRGHGVGGHLVDQCIRFAAAAGYQRMRLWTNDVLVAARQLYLSRGFTLVAEDRHHSFGADLVGQIYELDVVAGAATHDPARPTSRHD
ncbi:MAG: GNAT family N-acetyltransferase [Pseudonocardiales bacterium]